ncbi:MAG: PAS domain-containing protein [Bacteroidota bacterium]|nr:PAS domain-containing protein [Bacteroidota bacterium]
MPANLPPWLLSSAGATPLPLAETPTDARARKVFEQVFAHTPAAICVLRGPAHRYVYLNAAYQQFFPDRALLGHDVAEVLPETVQAGFVALLDAVYLTGETYFGHEVPMLLAEPDGGPAREMFFTFTYQAYREQGEIIGISVLAYVVSEQVRVRRQHEAQQQRFGALVEQAPVAIAVFRGPQYVIELANPAVCGIWGRTLAQTLGTPLFELLPEAAGQGFEDLLDEVMATGVPYVAHELPSFIDRGGRRDTVYWNFVYQPLREATGHISGVTVVATEVSEQVQARQQVQALNKELAAANAALHTTNAELHAHNAELRRTQKQLQQLNQTLDARVAERTQAAHAARADAERHRLRLERLFMGAPAAIGILAGPALVFELVNPAYQAMLPRRDLLERPLLVALPELAGQPVLALLRQVYETGRTCREYGMLIPIASTDDAPPEDRYFDFTYQARYDEHGRIDGVLVFAFEVSMQVRAHQECEATATQLRLLTDALPVLISYVDHEHRYQFNNYAYEAWFGQPAAALKGRLVREVVGEAAYLGVLPYFEQALAGERVDFEARMPYRKDFVKHIRTSFVPDVQAGRVAGFYSLVTDVTQEVESRQQVQALNQQLGAVNHKLYAANEALAESNVELGAANEALDDSNQLLTHANVDLSTFVYVASHDLRGPITNLTGLLHALRDELPPAALVGQPAHILNLMQDSADRFLQTITQLGAIGHLQQEAGLVLAPTLLADVIRDVRLDLAPQIAALGAQVLVALEGFPTFPFAEKNLRSVVYNLLSNALKYHHPGRVPLVHLRCRLATPYWVLEVQDNGLGLALTPERPLFGLFQRYHSHVEGSGVGLYMVKKMVENAGGHIEVQSELGVGSTFSVYFRH